MTDTILQEADGGILTITLNRPDKLNALTDEMLHALKDALKQAKRDDSVRAIVLTGAGRGFCPGQDLGSAHERGADSGDFGYGDHLRETYNPIILGMRTMPKPVISAINGVAAGAGMSLALAPDYRIAAESATFLQAFVKVGLIPDSGSTWLLPRLIGEARAMEMMLTGRRIDAATALEWGLVNEVVPDDELMDRVQTLAKQFAEGPTKAIGYIKQGVMYASDAPLEDALAYEADLQDMAGRTADHVEGLNAFFEKRQANFKGE
ncbi:MAG: 2-(1,2-epoxy-1,2-dihydrophenyl)acetyl-CoA isomerase [Chloroflexi bacterium]|nr:2-(1,2-epoxy-1,2-dihydrophenyl)acetyl-CoA isomerase [Chloroflexota bacterium]